MAVIEKSETGRRHIGASQTVAKLPGTASYFDFYDLKAVPGLLHACHRTKFISMPRNEGRSGIVFVKAAYAAHHDQFSVFKKDISMTISTRIALGISAAALSLSLALAPAAFAQDAMKKDDGMMKKDSMSKDDGAMKKDAMSKDSMKKDDGAMMKKDDGMMKKNDSK